ncbi:MAG: lipoprotein-releasing system transmembrane subunit LolC, partial [Bilophila sp.]
VLGVAIGVASLVVVLGVYNGFTTDIRDRILGANAHIIITGPLAALAPASVTQGATDTRGIGLEATLSRITSTPGVIG